LFAQAAAGLEATRGGRPTVRPGAFFVPGRIEVLGKHTDYAGGRTMVAATERGMAIVARARDDDRVQVTDAVRGETVVFRREPELVPPAGHWANYPITVARRLARNFAFARRGAAISFASDLPPAAGMSSSSTLMVATFLALDHVQPFSGEPLFQREIANLTDLAGYLATVENGQTFGALEGDRGVGTFGGSEDHTAILCAQPGQISQYGYCPVRFERAVGLPPGHQLAIAVSGVVAEKTGAARERYNRASQRATEIVRLWRRATGADHQHLATVLASSADAAGRLSQIVAAVQDGDFTADELSARMEHFFIENEQLVPAAGDALACGDLAAFGRLVDRSQQASQQLLGNQVPQTVFLAAVARAEGAAAASAFGAGFGGSVWALVDTARAEDFLAAWSTAYGHQFPENAPAATFFLTAAGPAAFQLSG
jgi:galactokinase